MFTRSLRARRPRFAMGVLVVVSAAGFSDAGVIHVRAGLATGANNGASWGDAYRGRLGLVAALAAAGPGDQVWVAAGEYAPAAAGGSRMASFMLEDGVEILGGFAGHETSADQRDPFINFTTLTGDLNDNDTGPESNTCDNAAHVVRSVGRDATAVIDGFVIEGGYAADCGSMNVVDREEGAGMLIEGGGPTVRRCFFLMNVASWTGGGLCVDGAAPVLVGCEFDRNKCYAWGAGAATINASSATFDSCIFIENSGNQGPGLHAGARFGEPVSDGGTVAVRGCWFFSNVGEIGAANGGAMNVSWCSANVDNCLIANNYANGGGGIFVDGGSLVAVNTAFAGNLANGDLGDAVYLLEGSASLSGCTVTGHLRRDNQGDASAFIVRGAMDVDNCTIARNGGADTGADWGAGVFVMQMEGDLKVRNSIIWDNRTFNGGGQQAVVTFAGGGTARFDNSCVQGWNGSLTGTGSFNANPLLADVDGNDNQVGTTDDNVRLVGGSPCIDRGNNLIVAVHGPTDMDGSDRFINDVAAADTGTGGGPGGCAIIDVGAFEYPDSAACPADVDCSGFVDTEDFDRFVLLFEAGDPAADFDLSGFVDTDDFDRFVESFEAGC
ncbi:MAG: hypothetical protein GIKADHBN_00522 [Phycisphaerales bacterium]|nr:hypothetical protein [Phycisphaerales bacterium]